MSVSQPLPLTPDNINIPAPRLYLAHLLFILQAETLLHFIDASAVDKADFTRVVRTQTKISGDVIHFKVRDVPLCCQVKVNLIS